MATTERVTITLPKDLVRDIDKLERNRSRFIAQAVEHELLRRRREELLRSLKHPHPDAAGLADAGLGEWAAGLPDEAENLVDPDEGKPVRWIEGKGWVEGPE
jgi:predicted transcriptional regulator